MLVTFSVLVVAPVVSYFTGRITVRVDTSTEATVGITRLSGFPIWFYEQAPGISIMSSWHPERFVWNTALWIAIFGAFAMWRLRRKYKSQ